MTTAARMPRLPAPPSQAFGGCRVHGRLTALQRCISGGHAIVWGAHGGGGRPERYVHSAPTTAHLNGPPFQRACNCTAPLPLARLSRATGARKAHADMAPPSSESSSSSRPSSYAGRSLPGGVQQAPLQQPAERGLAAWGSLDTYCEAAAMTKIALILARAPHRAAPRLLPGARHRPGPAGPRACWRRCWLPGRRGMGITG